MNQLEVLIADAKNQVGYRAIHNEDGDVRHVLKKPAASVITSSLRELTLPPYIASGDSLHRIHCPTGERTGQRTTLNAALLQASRVAQAGAQIVVARHAPDAIEIPGGGIALPKRNAGITLVEAADFALVPDADPLAVPPQTGEVAVSALPVYQALVDLETMPSYAVRFELSRADLREREPGQLADLALVSIAAGLARAVDQSLLSGIVAASPAAFSLGAAAALGIEFAELRALVGTAGNAAAVGQDGTLRAAGVLAELTPTVAATVVGAFNRAAVAVHDDLVIVAERTGRDGGLIITCWANIQELLPLPGAFWLAA